MLAYRLSFIMIVSMRSDHERLVEQNRQAEFVERLFDEVSVNCRINELDRLLGRSIEGQPDNLVPELVAKFNANAPAITHALFTLASEGRLLFEVERPQYHGIEQVEIKNPALPALD